jgi:hypothetical protein
VTAWRYWLLNVIWAGLCAGTLAALVVAVRAEDLGAFGLALGAAVGLFALAVWCVLVTRPERLLRAQLKRERVERRNARRPHLRGL